MKVKELIYINCACPSEEFNRKTEKFALYSQKLLIQAMLKYIISYL